MHVVPWPRGGCVVSGSMATRWLCDVSGSMAWGGCDVRGYMATRWLCDVSDYMATRRLCRKWLHGHEVAVM